MAGKDRWPELCASGTTDYGLPVRKAGQWTEDKLYYWHRYVEITTGGMKYLWKSGLTFVDLFSGPGVCYNKPGKKRFPGSPLVAAWAVQPFKKMIFVELDANLAAACHQRLRSSGTVTDFQVIPGNCNEVIDRVLSEIPKGTLTLAFIDPESLQVRFDALRAPANNARADLLILFPVGYDIIRNIRLYELQDESRLGRV